MPSKRLKPIRHALTQTTTNGIRIPECAADMPHLPVGRFARRDGEARIHVFACGFPAKDKIGAVQASDDGGATWTPLGLFGDEQRLRPTDSGAFLVSRNGTLIAAFSNQAEKSTLVWDPELKDSPGARLPLYVARSCDGGRTWQDLQKLHDAWTGASRDILQTRDGRIVLCTTMLLHNPGRHSVLTYASDDDGRTWTASNTIDLGGNGNHDGVSEATALELRDGTLLKYIRTNWGRFWRALSHDGGRHWHPYGPAPIACSSAPGVLVRLHGGRVALLWNRPFPEGKRSVPLRGGDGMWSATPASVFRHELSIAFSDDDCATWSAPAVLAHNPRGEVSYPYLFEVEPGVFWITATRGGLAMRIREADLFAHPAPGA